MEKSLKIVVDKKEGNINELKELIGGDDFYKFTQVGIISTWGSHWNITEFGSSVYKSFYKKPNLLESLKGLYCHYILKF
jgi:hypothetical protein